MMSPGGPRHWIRHNKGRSSHCRLDTSPRWSHHISQLSRHTTEHRRIGPGVLLTIYFIIVIMLNFLICFINKWSLFKMKKYYVCHVQYFWSWSWLWRSQAWVKMSPAQGHKLFIIFSLALKGIVADNAWTNSGIQGVMVVVNCKC